MDGRLSRRLAGVLAARLPEVGFDEVDDPRRNQGKRWSMESLLTAVVVGAIAGCRSLGEAEDLTGRLSPAMRRRLRLGRRVPDTTLRDIVTKVEPDSVRGCLHRMTQAARRRKALQPWGLPFGVVALDGKTTTVPEVDNVYAQRSTLDSGKVVGKVRTVTACLVSSQAAPCIDAVPIPASTNEMGVLPTVLCALEHAYGRELFRLVSYDAGAVSEDNMRAILAHGWDYLLAVKGNQPVLSEMARKWLAGVTCRARTEDVLTNDEGVIRELFIVPLERGFHPWTHLRTVLAVRSRRVKAGRVSSEEERIYASSLAFEELTSDQWLSAVRRHWSVENRCHWTWDVVFDEDARPWIEADPRGTLVVMLLRRVAYNVLALFRSVTLRSDENRQMPWRKLLSVFRDMLVSAHELVLEGFRQRPALTN